MDFQLPITAQRAEHNSRGMGRTTLPLRLSMRSGERLGGLLPGVDAASALVIAECDDGAFQHSFHPLRLHLNSLGGGPSAGEWSLYGVRSGAEGWAYFLGIPDAFIASFQAQRGARSLTVQIVGHSAFRADASFAGQVCLSLGAVSESSWIPRFERFVDQWIPALLPEAFIASASLARIEEADAREIASHSIWIISLARSESGETPPSLRLDWDPVAWNDAVLEPAGPGGRGHFSIRGGCFISPEGRVSHWFGGRIGLNLPGFRERVSRQLLKQAPVGQASWCFWTEPVPALPTAVEGETSLRIRHPVLAWAWNGFSDTPVDASPLYRQASDMLRDAARLRAFRHVDWERLLYGSDPASRKNLETEVGAFYRRHESVLVRLAEFQAAAVPASGAFHPLAAMAEFAASVLRKRGAT